MNRSQDCLERVKILIWLVNPWPSWLISTNRSEFSSGCFADLIWFRLSKNSCSCWAFKSSFFDSILSLWRFVYHPFPRAVASPDITMKLSGEPWLNEKSFLESEYGKNNSYSANYCYNDIRILTIWAFLMLFNFFLCLWHFKIFSEFFSRCQFFCNRGFSRFTYISPR